VHDLRKPVDGIVKAIVEAMHEDEYFACSALVCCARYSGGKGSLVEIG
jgi:hypothetical protein